MGLGKQDAIGAPDDHDAILFNRRIGRGSRWHIAAGSDPLGTRRLQVLAVPPVEEVRSRMAGEGEAAGHGPQAKGTPMQFAGAVLQGPHPQPLSVIRTALTDGGVGPQEPAVPAPIHCPRPGARARQGCPYGLPSVGLDWPSPSGPTAATATRRAMTTVLRHVL